MKRERTIDLDDEEYTILKRVIESRMPYNEIWAYGSRVKWNASESADLDLVVFGSDSSTLSDFRDALGESDLFISVDVMDWENISDDFKENIKKKYVVVQKNTMPKGWGEVKLGDLGKIISGKTPSFKNPEDWGNEMPFVTPTDYKNYRKFVFSAERMLSKEGIERLERIVLPPNSIMVTCIGHYVGKITVNKVSVVTNQQINSITPNCEIVDLGFLYYSLINIHGHFQMLGAGSTAIPIINKRTFEGIHIIVAPLPEQKSIAEILSSLDDKIDLLHRQNKTLETMAQTLFRKWFIEGIKNNWKKGKLKDITSTIESGKRPKGGINQNLKEGYPSIGAESINGIGNFNFKETKFISKDFFNSLTRGIVKDYDVLIYKDGAYIGKKAMFGLGFPFKDFAINEHVFILRSNEKANQYFLYFLLQQEKLYSLNANSAQPGLNQTSMMNLEITIPPIELIKKFGESVNPLVDKILMNSKQILALEKMRDFLLPKLMSGKIRVSLKSQ